MVILTDDLVKLLDHDDIESHIFELYTSSASLDNQNLGFIDSKSAQLEVTVRDETFEVEQSPTLLTSNSIASTTGFVAWKSAPLFAEWFLYHNGGVCPALSGLKVLELGAGSSGVLACCISTRVRHYIATDQGPLLKQLKKNIAHNLGPRLKSSTISSDSCSTRDKKNKKKYCEVDVIELDWESPESGIYELKQQAFQADLIVASDTIYNDFLIAPLVHTLDLLAHEDTDILIAIHLRDFEIVEEFLDQCLAVPFDIWFVDDSHLTEGLKHGYALYWLKKRKTPTSV